MGILKEQKIYVFDKDVIRVGMPIQVIWKRPLSVDNGIVAKVDGTILTYVCAYKDCSGTSLMKVEATHVLSGVVDIKIGKFE